MEHFFEIFKHTLVDTAKMLPFLFGVYLLIEFLEHKASDKLPNALRKMGPFGPIGGAALGCLPQCGFSVAASNLYSGRLISLGTLLAVYIATSDEAIPILLADPNGIKDVWKLVVAKIIIAVIAGLFVDSVIRFLKRKSNEDSEPYVDLCENCGCEEHGVFYSALKHTIQIFIFLFVIAFALEAAMHLAGEELLGKILMQDSWAQPLLAALIGLIPNCAPSVVLTNLYVSGSLSFGSIVSGLSTGAGLGLVVLFKVNKNLKQNFAIVGGLYAISAAAGLIIDLVF